MAGAERSFVIVGGGTAGWMAAAALARFAPPNTRIRLVESDEIGTVGVGEATIPQIRLFNQSLGLDENEFVRETNGSFKLGIEFVGWSASGADDSGRYIHAFGTIGRGLGLVPFHHYWLRHAGKSGAAGYWDYSPTALAAKRNAFARDLGRPELPSGVAWAFHFDAVLYAGYLRRYAEARGVQRTEEIVADVSIDGGTGHVVDVTLRSGERVAGDFFIDCSGFRGLLIEGALAAGYDDWRGFLPCDRALAVPSANVGPLTPYTRATAREAGWQWRIPLQHRTGNGLVYSSAHLSDERAAEILLTNLDGPALSEPRPLRFVTGRRRKAWVGNCVALGLAAGFLEPLESTSIHLIQSGIARLLELYPTEPVSSADIAEYNRQTEAEWLAVRDFLVLHYHANTRVEPFWAERRAAEIPDSLHHRMELFRQSGRVVAREDDLFKEPAWVQVLLGQGLMPERHHPLANALPPDQLDDFLRLARAHAAQVANRMPLHDQYIAAHCAASRKAAA